MSESAAAAAALSLTTLHAALQSHHFIIRRPCRQFILHGPPPTLIVSQAYRPRTVSPGPLGPAMDAPKLVHLSFLQASTSAIIIIISGPCRDVQFSPGHRPCAISPGRLPGGRYFVGSSTSRLGHRPVCLQTLLSGSSASQGRRPLCLAVVPPTRRLFSGCLSLEKLCVKSWSMLHAGSTGRSRPLARARALSISIRQWPCCPPQGGAARRGRFVVKCARELICRVCSYAVRAQLQISGSLQTNHVALPPIQCLGVGLLYPFLSGVLESLFFRVVLGCCRCLHAGRTR